MLNKATWWGLGIAAIIGALIGALVMWWWYDGHPITVTKTLTVNVPVSAKAAPQLKDVPQAPVKLATCSVQAYKSPSATRAHLLPAPVAVDQHQAVVASTRVDPDEHPETVTSTVNDATGQVQTFVVKEPYPLLAKDTRRDIAVAYGYKASQGGLQRVLRIEARQDMADVLGVHVGAFLRLDTPIGGGPVNGFVGIGLHKPF